MLCNSSAVTYGPSCIWVLPPLGPKSTLNPYIDCLMNECSKRKYRIIHGFCRNNHHEDKHINQRNDFCWCGIRLIARRNAFPIYPTIVTAVVDWAQWQIHGHILWDFDWGQISKGFFCCNNPHLLKSRSRYTSNVIYVQFLSNFIIVWFYYLLWCSAMFYCSGSYQQGPGLLRDIHIKIQIS